MIQTFRHLFIEEVSPPRVDFVMLSQRPDKFHFKNASKKGGSRSNAVLQKFLLRDSRSCTCRENSENSPDPLGTIGSRLAEMLASVETLLSTICSVFSLAHRPLSLFCWPGNYFTSFSILLLQK